MLSICTLTWDQLPLTKKFIASIKKNTTVPFELITGQHLRVLNARVAAPCVRCSTLDRIELDASYRPFWSGSRWRARAWQELGTLPTDLVVWSEAATVTARL